MAITADRVIVELEAKIDRYDANVRRAEQRFRDAMRGIGNESDRSSRLVGSAMRYMGTALAGVSAVVLARQFLAMTDEAKKMDAQLRLATASMGSFREAQEDVRRISEGTRSDLSATANLYASFARGARELGINQRQVADITQTVGQAFKISGTSAGDSANAIRQLSQAFASGVLRGDEFNSIMENAPRLARLLADSLGVPQGALRAMAEEGELTADKLVRAFSDKKFTEGLQAEFDQIPVTFDDAMTLLYNSAVITFSEFDRGGQFSAAIAQFVTDSAGGFDDMGVAAENFGRTVSSELAGVIAVAGELRDVLAGIVGVLNSIDAASGGVLGRASALVAGGPLGIALRLARASPTYQNAANARNRSLRLQAGEQNVRDIFAGRDVFGNRIGGDPPPGPRAPSRPGGRRRTGGRATRSPLDPEAFAREEARLGQAILREKEQGAETAAARAAIELDRLQAEQAQEAVETNANEKYTAEQKARLVALQGSVFALRRLQVVAERDEEMAEQAAKLSEEKLRREEANARLESDALESQLRFAETAAERLAIERRLLDIAESRERIALEAEIAEGKIADAAKARADLATLQANRREGVERDNAGPLDRYRREIDRSADEIGELAEEWLVDELESVREGLRNAITDKLGVDDPILSGLIDLFIEQAIIRPLANYFAGQAGGGGGLIGGLFSAVGSLFGVGGGIGGGRASGGHVIAGQLYRVNEGGGGIEGFVPAQSGQIVPLGRMRGASAPGGGGDGFVRVQLALSGDINARIDQRSAGVAVEIVRQAQPYIVDNAVNETMDRVQRPRI